MSWYNDETLQKDGEKCDELIDKFIFNFKKGNNINNLLFMLIKQKNLMIKKADNSNDIVSSRYYYYAINCLSQYIDNRTYPKEDFKSKDKDYKDLLSLFRSSIENMHKYTNSVIHLSNTEGIYFINYYNSLMTNYAILLDKLGRNIPSINILNKLYENNNTIMNNNFLINSNFLMIIANLISSLRTKIRNTNYYYSNTILLCKIYPLLITVINNASIIKRNSYYSYMDEYKNDYNLIVGHNLLEGAHCHISKDAMQHYSYKKWVLNNCLSLNNINDINDNINFYNDNINIQFFYSKSNSSISNNIFNIINTIKQEYVSSRFDFFKGIQNKNKIHYSDSNNTLANVNNNNIYGYYMEEMKKSFRSIYSIFDKISYALNIYLKLGINLNNISFKNLFSKKNYRNITKYPHFSKIKLYISALKWIKKDLYDESNYNSSFDNKLSLAKDIRNSLEHKSINILRSKNKVEHNDYSINISFNVFKDISIHLLYVCREAIITFISIINRIELEKSDSIVNEDIPTKYIYNIKNIDKKIN